MRNKEQPALINSSSRCASYYNALESGTEMRHPIRETNLLIKLLRSSVIIWCALLPFLCIYSDHHTVHWFQFMGD